MFLANRNIRQQNAVRQLPCSHPGCNRYFKTSAGRTKHRHANHPIITPSPTAPVGPSSLPQNGQDPDAPDLELNPLSENDTESGLGPSTPLHAMESQFYGPGDRLYRNYHPKLTGNVTDFKISVGLLTSKIQQSRAMSTVNSLPLGPLQLPLLLIQMTGPLSMIARSLKRLTCYTPASKCRHHKSMH